MGGQVCTRNSALNEKFVRLPPSVREIHVGGQVCMRYLLITDTQSFNASSSRSALFQGIKILNNAQSKFLPPSSGSNFDTDVTGTQDVVKFSVITPKTL